METADFFRARIDAMINLNDPLAVLATRLPWAQIEAALQAKFERQARAGRILEGQDLLPTDIIIVLHEPALDNWGIRGQPASEVDLGFSLNV